MTFSKDRWQGKADRAPAKTRGASRSTHPRATTPRRRRDGGLVCPAPASAFSDAAMSCFALARLTSRVDYAGSALLSGVVPLSGTPPRLPSRVRALLER